MTNFKNGAVVSRVYEDGSTELLSTFQYFTHAEEWAKNFANDPTNCFPNCFMVVTDLYSGTCRVFKAKTEETN